MKKIRTELVHRIAFRVPRAIMSEVWAITRLRKRRLRDMVRIVAGALLVLALGGAAQGQIESFVAAPDGDDNGECTDARPCSPQGAVKACPMSGICNIRLQPGI